MKVGARGRKNRRQGSGSLPLAPKGDPGTEVQLPACTCFPCLLAGSLSLTQSWALIILFSHWLKTTTPLVTPSPTGNHSLSLEAPQLHTASHLLDPWSLERPRFCLLSKEKGKSFGFHLQQELGRAGHVVCRVDPGTSAQRQGLQEGDRILAVNNDVVEHEDYAVVVRRIRASGPRVLLTVLARHAHDVARAQLGEDAHLCPTLGPGVRPRLCHIVKDEGGFGFGVTHGNQGPFWLVLSTGGAAERSGVPPGARLLEVNGLWQSGQQVTLLVAGPEVEEQCRQLGLPLAAPLAEGWALPTKPRCLQLEKGPQGFGFLLREEKGPDGRPGQFLWEVDPGLPAKKAGMQAGDRLVAVAGESVEGLGHEETVSRIQAQGSCVSLIVVDPEADRFFRMVRLSPLLFLENTEAPASPQGSSSASLVETEVPSLEDTGVPSVPLGSRQCFLYPGPGGGYGFRLSCAASGPRLFISQVTPGGSAARAGLQVGDVILEVNGYPVGGEDDLERLQQLPEAEPPLCLKLAARSLRGLEAWIPTGAAEDWALASDLL
ncbi:Na(+)/H(+) exchange regulatory cofactor NHE-RF4 isoform X2 [Rhinopithecus roxellana]|uniref:Na(+)/H(+) exchange regulatory cofactor NHE-RF4 isoform X2 n=1 Tax=Rhinopithecus roxellana TaxID=61622 RepID=UPI0012371280|nr:Na(+)/H(+) exchange regulatory cofactor NHE-RF4 isoform X2 [Rhinopithecus roxellana]